MLLVEERATLNLLARFTLYYLRKLPCNLLPWPQFRIERHAEFMGCSVA